MCWILNLTTLRNLRPQIKIVHLGKWTPEAINVPVAQDNVFESEMDPEMFTGLFAKALGTLNH